MVAKLIRAVAALGLFLSASASAQAQSRYLVFGDSLSDSGNLFTATGNPPAPYYQGHFSNGLTWFEQIAGTPKNFFTFTGGGASNVDFAFGGARSDGTLFSTGLSAPLPYGLQAQIASYFGRGGTIAATDTVALWAGANNLFNAFDTTYPGYTTPTQAGLAAVMTSAAADMKTAVATLVANGARNIVILNLPDLGSTPAYLGTAGQAAASFATGTFNVQLAGQMAALKAANPGLNIVQVDISSVSALVSANPAAFGFTNASAACVTTPSCVAAAKSAQNQYAFWDSVHPTEASHALIASVVLQYLNAQANDAGLSRLADTTLSTRAEAGGRTFSRFDDVRRGARRDEAPYVELIGSRLSGSNAYRSNAIGLAVGLHHVVDPRVALVVEGFMQGGDFRGGLYESQVWAGGVDVALQYTDGRYFLRGGAGASFGYFGDLERSTVFSLKNSSSQSGVSGGATLEGGLAYQVGSVEVSPRARLGVLASNFGETTEAGVVAPLTLGGRTVTTLTGGAEVQASTVIINDGAQKISLTGTLGYERWFGMSDYQITATLANNTGNAFKLGGANPTGPGVIAGLGLGGRIAERTFASISYRAGVGQHTTRQDLRASLQLQF